MRPSRGSPRIRVLLRREDWLVNHKRMEHLFRLEVLNLMQNRRRRPRAAATRGTLVAAIRKDNCWSMDFMHDQLQDGRRLRVLTVVDQYTRGAGDRGTRDVLGARRGRPAQPAIEVSSAADGQRAHRVVQHMAAHRVPERARLRVAQRCRGNIDHAVERLQRRASSQRSGHADP